MSEASKPFSMGVAGATPVAPTNLPTKAPDLADLKRLRRMGRKMLSVFEELDPKVAKSMEGMNVSCKSACAGCCYQLILVSLPEAVAVAEYFLQDVQRRQLIPLLMRSFWEQLQTLPSADTVMEARQKYFAKKIPCTFLALDTKLCTIYDVRPAACRYHYVVSDPVLCSPEQGLKEVGMVNTRAAGNQVLSAANKVSGQTKIGFYVAPMPVAMLWAFKLLIEGRESFETALKETDLGPMDLSHWQARFNPQGTGAAP